ncbi:AIM24 family protein [Brevibacillus sp. NPDC058079]|uniref:AIM24 family protein n=1 Tax=Brevibacillus sp. NPDC058079 TaxID=3346330 RepID=UPI0036E84689
MGFVFQQHNELTLKAEGNGIFFAKKGSMIADQGRFKYSKRLLGTNQGNIAGQVINHLARKITGENLEIMEVSGQGTAYMADQGAHANVITLEPNGPWQSVSVESENLLAFTDTCHYGVSVVGTGVLSQRGLFTSKLTYNGHNAQVCVKTEGNAIVLEAPCRVDPDAVVAWTGKNPTVKLDVSWKTLIGQTSGESYIYEFNEPGQVVIVQPYERESGVKLGIDDRRYQPEMQSSSFGNTFGGQGGLPGGMGQSGQANQQGGLSGILGSILGNK